MNIMSGMNIKAQSSTIFAGNLMMPKQGALKSTQEKIERMQQTSNQVNYWEDKKGALKNMECENMEEIAKKLDMFHTYEDQITSAKAEYNNEQMYHVLDEAKEKGEKIAEAADESKPKTEEERKEEAIEESLGTEEREGIMSEVMDKVSEITEEMIENAEEGADLAAESALLEEVSNPTIEKSNQTIQNVSKVENLEEAENLSQVQEIPTKNQLLKEEYYKLYKSFDYRV